MIDVGGACVLLTVLRDVGVVVTPVGKSDELGTESTELLPPDPMVLTEELTLEDVMLATLDPPETLEPIELLELMELPTIVDPPLPLMDDPPEALTVIEEMIELTIDVAGGGMTDGGMTDVGMTDVGMIVNVDWSLPLDALDGGALD